MGSHYCQLKLEERRKLAKWLEARMPISQIADRLGRNPSTIYRDIKRNRYTDTEIPELNGYHALVAQDKYEQRRAIHRKMIVHPELKELDVYQATVFGSGSGGIVGKDKN